MPPARGGDESAQERRARLREERRERKKRKRMPVHGAALKKVSEIWQKRTGGGR